MAQLNIKIDDDLKNELRLRSFKAGMTFKDYIAKVLRESLKKEK